MASKGWVKSNLSPQETADIQATAIRRANEMREMAQKKQALRPKTELNLQDFVAENTSFPPESTAAVTSTPRYEMPSSRAGTHSTPQIIASSTAAESTAAGSSTARYEMPSSRAGTHSTPQIIASSTAAENTAAGSSAPRYEMPSSRAGTHSTPQIIASSTAAENTAAVTSAPRYEMPSSRAGTHSTAQQVKPAPAAERYNSSAKPAGGFGSIPKILPEKPAEPKRTASSTQPAAGNLKPLPSQTVDIGGDKLANLLALMAITDKPQNRDKALVTALLYLLT